MTRRLRRPRRWDLLIHYGSTDANARLESKLSAARAATCQAAASNKALTTR